MEILISLSTDYNSYRELCEVDDKIREMQRDQVEALPAVIFYLDELLAPMLLRHTQLKQQLRLKDASGPFYSDHYLHEGQKRPWPQV